MSIIARRFPPVSKRDVVTVACRSDATFKGLASAFGISVDSFRRWMKQADLADGLAAGPSDAGPDGVVALRRRLRLLEQENEVLRRAAARLPRDVLPK